MSASDRLMRKIIRVRCFIVVVVVVWLLLLFIKVNLECNLQNNNKTVRLGSMVFANLVKNASLTAQVVISNKLLSCLLVMIPLSSNNLTALRNK